MTPIDRRMKAKIIRARSVLGLLCYYKLGEGGLEPRSEHPARVNRDGRPQCDCSGFACWVYSISRLQGDKGKPWSSQIQWVNTDAMVRDANGPQRLFTRLDGPVPGCIVVYGRKGQRVGHCAVLTEVSPTGRIFGIDCASGAFGLIGQAIRERGLDWMLGRGAIYIALNEDMEQ
jgi:hypothetical protein